MRALLLAAGMGLRLLPITASTAKCMVEINGRPLLDYWLELLFAGGVERVLVNTHWLEDQVIDFVRASRWADRVDLVHEEELLGTGGTVLANRDWFKGQPFIVAHADNLTDFDVSGFISAHLRRPSGHAITMRSIDIWQVRDGLFVEHWDELNTLEVFQQLGVIPPLG